MGEAVSNCAKDGAQMVVACSLEVDFLSHLPLSLLPLEAANDNHRSWPHIPFYPGWYVTCLGDCDLG